ncbi:hypothetical protein [Sediminibacterium soli]|uniref:hypothetical protein n=1 Tax=Sediminibacterium soli TaxID=2698829 RepID=UPI00137B29D2|nr:hypothetical protein [Sediminibacterium soli]NCI48252.1 hypothetical protein [Sediminibacterium soli]
MTPKTDHTHEPVSLETKHRILYALAITLIRKTPYPWKPAAGKKKRESSYINHD